MFPEIFSTLELDLTDSTFEAFLVRMNFQVILQLVLVAQHFAASLKNIIGNIELKKNFPFDQLVLFLSLFKLQLTDEQMKWFI